MAAFRLALAHGADGIELDVKLTSDEQIADIHDQTVDRTTNGRGRVDKLRMSDLQRLDADSHFDPAFKGETIPGLADMLSIFGSRPFLISS